MPLIFFLKRNLGPLEQMLKRSYSKRTTEEREKKRQKI